MDVVVRSARELPSVSTCLSGPCTEQEQELTRPRFCSDQCAYKQAKILVETIRLTAKRNIKQLSTSLCSYPKPSGATITHHIPVTLPTTLIPVKSVNTELANLQNQIDATKSATNLVKKRQMILQQAISRCETLTSNSVVVNVNGNGNGDKARKGGGDDRACGWERRLVWENEEVLAGTLGQEEEGEGVEVCSNGRKRCDRHQGCVSSSSC